MKHFLILVVVWITVMFTWYQLTPYTREYIRLLIRDFRVKIILVGLLALIVLLLSSVSLSSVSIV